MESPPPQKAETNQKRLQKIMEAMKHDPSSAIKDLHELRTISSPSLSRRLSKLTQSIHKLENLSRTRNFVSIVTGKVMSLEVTRLVAEIESEMQPVIDREALESLTDTISQIRSRRSREELVISDLSPSPSEFEKLFNDMSMLQQRLSRGFDINLQDLLLKYGIFDYVKWVLCSSLFSNRVHEKAAVLIKELVLFNKDVFVGSVLTGGCVKALVSMGTECSLQVLSSLIRAIRSPLVDELESCGGISKIIGYLWSEDLGIRTTALDCMMEIGYFGRKEAVEAMINGDVVQRLLELQRLELMDGEQDKKIGSVNYHLITRFAVQLEVGEGLRQREKRAFKQEILKKIKEANCVSDAESATILAEVLWGSSP